MNKPRVFADFHNADPQGRLRLNCMGTVEKGWSRPEKVS